jgi:hypothetical protein
MEISVYFHKVGILKYAKKLLKKIESTDIDTMFHFDVRKQE